MTIERRLNSIRARLAEACARAERNPSEVTLVAVSKGHPPEAIREAHAHGQRDFGENYVQEWVGKTEALADLEDLRWHFIGSLQTNKARLVARHGCALVHTVDRRKLAVALDRRVADGETLDVLLQVNIGDELTKGGVDADALALHDLLASVLELERIQPRGLMTIPPARDDTAASLRDFARLRDLRDRLAASTGTDLPVLSMGMSADFESAVASGATHVRIGTAIFGARDYR